MRLKIKGHFHVKYKVVVYCQFGTLEYIEVIKLKLIIHVLNMYIYSLWSHIDGLMVTDIKFKGHFIYFYIYRI